MDIHQNYERVIPQKSLKRKILGICGYILSALIGVLIFLSNPNAYVAALVISAVVILILITKKYLSVELEYSFMGGIFTISKIFGKSSRKVITEVDLSSCISINYATEEAMARAASIKPSETVDASQKNADGDILVAIWEIDKKRGVLLFNADERTLKILYRANAQSCSQEIRIKAR